MEESGGGKQEVRAEKGHSSKVAPITKENHGRSREKERGAHKGINDVATERETRQVLQYKRQWETMTHRCRTLAQRRVITGARNLTGHGKQR